MKIVDGVYQVDGVNCNVYLIEEPDGLTLIDSGLPRSDKKILKYIEELGHKHADLKTIVITHFHIDHVGGLKKVKDATGAKVAVHLADANIVAGKEPAPKPKNLVFRALGSVFKASAVEPDLLLNDGDRVAELLVIHVPGHSEGSIALLDEKRKVLFAGDAARFVDGKLQGPPEQYTLDMAKAKESIKKLATFNFEVMLSGHGQPLTTQASKKLEEFETSMQSK